nr:hypothetical protein [uncultured Rhodopila sp.]
MSEVKRDAREAESHCFYTVLARSARDVRESAGQPADHTSAWQEQELPPAAAITEDLSHGTGMILQPAACIAICHAAAKHVTSLMSCIFETVSAKTDFKPTIGSSAGHRSAAKSGGAKADA